MSYLTKIIMSGIAAWLAAYILPGISIDGFITSVLVALAISILNSILKPILIVLTIPITILSLGIFLLFINAFIIYIASRLIDGFNVDGVWWAIAFSILMSIFTSLFEDKDKAKKA